MTKQFLSTHHSLQRNMTPQLQKAIHMLQLPYEALVPLVQEQITMNPFLSSEPEEDFDPSAPEEALLSSLNDKKEFYEQSLEAPHMTLQENILKQIDMLLDCPKEKILAKAVAEKLDPDGYLRHSDQDLACVLRTSPAVIQSVIQKLQSFEPSGVFSRTLAENFSLQLKERGIFSNAYNTLIQNLNAFYEGIISEKTLMKQCQVSKTDLNQMLQTLRTLMPTPTQNMPEEKIPSACVEVIALWVPQEQRWQVTLNKQTALRVQFDRSYYDLTKKQASSSEEKTYLHQQLQHGTWLKKAIQQRTQNLLAISQEIVKQQAAFLHKGIAHMKPLILSQVASSLGIHESTVSRITTQKYIATPQGVFELKFFFSSGFERGIGTTISSESIRTIIQKTIAQESPKEPLSDAVLTNILNKQGIPVARRTIAKYREDLGILPSFDRRKSYRFTSLIPETVKTKSSPHTK